jgi:hypothetical protein
MAEKPGVRINGQVYEFVDQFKHGDPILIHEVTGLDWDEFSEMLARAGDGGRPNPIVQTALIAVAVQRVHTTWTRRDVSEFIRELTLGEEEYLGGEGRETGDAVPPDGSGESSNSSDEPSGTSPESQSSLSLIASGDPGSDTITPESRRAG